MSRVRTFFKRHSMSAVLVAVVVPLAVLLVLQYRWLVRLERVSAIADQATLDNYLEAVAQEVDYFYTSQAERALNLPESVFEEGCLDSVAYHFKKKKVEGARRLFVVNYRGDRPGVPVFFDSQGRRDPPDLYSAEERAVYVATASWSVLGKKGFPIGPTGLMVDERDPDHRIILNPITETLDADTGRLVGLAGMVVDADYLADRLLPRIVEGSLPKYFDCAEGTGPGITVTDGSGEVVFSTVAASGGGGGGGGALSAGDGPRRSLPFVFTDWHVGLENGGGSPEQIARGNFALNMTLAALIACLLLAGVAVALRTAARAVRLSEMKSDFVSNVSHELRTPLASIRVFGELLALGKVAEAVKVREYGARIEGESRRLTALINNILDFSRLESGHKSYEFEPVDLAGVAADVVGTFETRFRRSGFTVELETPPATLPPVRMDVGAISQVLSNLLDNAIKYSGDARRIAVRLSRRGSEVVLAVQDFGVGIPREEQKRIFERFHRVASSLVHDVKGSGLGLSLVDQIVSAHGGRVTVDSEPGRGSVFRVHLPIAGPAAEAAPAAATALPTSDALPEAR